MSRSNKVKYLGSIKTDDEKCTVDIRVWIGRVKIVSWTDYIGKDKDVCKDVKVKLLKALVWSIMSYGAEGSTVKKAEENRIMAAVRCFNRQMLRISWPERRTKKGILNELNVKHELLGRIVKETCILRRLNETAWKWACNESITGTIPGKKETRKTQHAICGQCEWSGRSLISNIQSAEDRSGWKDDNMFFAIKAA